MSLDVYLTVRHPLITEVDKQERIFIREDGQTREISRDEWNRRYPDREPVTVTTRRDDGVVFDQNITHNLAQMANEAGIYKHLWRPEEVGVTKAAELIEPLRNGLALMQSEPERFKAFNPENGWGSYDGFLPWIADYLAACEAYPDAYVSVSC